jgi:hypothetical protein
LTAVFAARWPLNETALSDFGRGACEMKSLTLRSLEIVAAFKV